MTNDYKRRRLSAFAARMRRAGSREEIRSHATMPSDTVVHLPGGERADEGVHVVDLVRVESARQR